MWTAALIALGVLTGLATRPALRALPEPVGDDAVDKTPYRALATPHFAATVAACSVVAGVLLAAVLPPVALIVWVPLISLGMLLVSIDALTTWLPLSLTRLLWLTTLAAIPIQTALVPADGRGSLLWRVALGAVVVGLFFWVFWRFTGGLGFGDVRLAPVLGAVTASVSWQTLVAGLLLGTLAGALVGLARRARNREGAFPYGPALMLGAIAGVLVTG